MRRNDHNSRFCFQMGTFSAFGIHEGQK